MASFYTETSNNISLEFAPWTDDAKFLLTCIHIQESLGGGLAGGSIDLRLDATDESALKFITEQNTGIIRIKDNKENGLSYEIPVCIHTRNHLLDTLHLDVLCVPSLDFITKKNTVSFDDIDSAIDKLYQGVKDIRTKPDSGVANQPEIQRCRSDYDFCNYLCKSYKKDSVFCFGWEGLMIKDRIGINSFGDEEESTKIYMVNGGSMTAASTQKMTYNSDLTEQRKPFFPFEDSEISLTQDDYSDKEPQNVTSMMFGEEYHIVGKDYKAHIENWKHNSKLLSTDLYYNIKIKGVDIPKYKIGDVINFAKLQVTDGQKDASNPYTEYIVKSNEFFYANDKADLVDSNGFKLSWTTLLIGIDKGEWGEIKKES